MTNVASRLLILRIERAECRLTQPFKLTAHEIREFWLDERRIRVLAELIVSISVSVDESKPESKQRITNTIAPTLRFLFSFRDRDRPFDETETFESAKQFQLHTLEYHTSEHHTLEYQTLKYHTSEYGPQRKSIAVTENQFHSVHFRRRIWFLFRVFDFA